METTALRLNSQETGSSTSLRLSKEQAEFSKQFAALPVKRVEELTASDGIQICQVDRQTLAINIAACIGDYLSFIGSPTSMTESATMETAQMMIDNHPHLPVEAIKTFFYECKRGAYGFHYNKMDGTKLLMWYDKFVNEYYVQLEDMEYNKHFSTKGDLAAVPNLQTEEGEPIDFNELMASFHGKSKEQMLLDKRIADLRKDVQKKYMHLFDEMPVDEADKKIEEAIIEEMKTQGLLTF